MTTRRSRLRQVPRNTDCSTMVSLLRNRLGLRTPQHRWVNRKYAFVFEAKWFILIFVSQTKPTSPATREGTRVRDYAREFTVASTLGGALEEEDEEEEQEEEADDGEFCRSSLASPRHRRLLLRAEQTLRTESKVSTLFRSSRLKCPHFFEYACCVYSQESYWRSNVASFSLFVPQRRDSL